MDGQASRDGAGLRTLERGLAVLELLGAVEGGLPLSEIAQRLDLATGTTHRLLRTLILRGYVEQDPRSRWYQLGLKILQLHGATIGAMRIASEARPHLRDLMLQTGERAHLAVYRGGAVVYIDNVDNRDSLARHVPIGVQRPAHATGLGKALLAYESPEELDAFLARADLTRFTDTTITDPDEFRRELAAIRERGVAVDRGERLPQVHCIAAPIFDSTGRPVAAVSVAGTPERIGSRASELAVCALVTARTISARLGYRPEDGAALPLAKLSALSPPSGGGSHRTDGTGGTARGGC